RLCLCLADKDHADHLAVAQQRSAQRGAKAADLLRIAPGEVRVGQYIRNMHNASLQCASSADTTSIDVHFPEPEQVHQTLMYFGAMTEARLEPQEIAVTLEQHSVVRLAKVRGGFDEGIEHGLQVESRAAYHLEDVCCRRLLLQRFPQVLGLRLDLVEQTDVLDRDHCLVGEGCDQ